MLLSLFAALSGMMGRRLWCKGHCDVEEQLGTGWWNLGRIEGWSLSKVYVQQRSVQHICTPSSVKWVLFGSVQYSEFAMVWTFFPEPFRYIIVIKKIHFQDFDFFLYCKPHFFRALLFFRDFRDLNSIREKYMLAKMSIHDIDGCISLQKLKTAISQNNKSVT